MNEMQIFSNKDFGEVRTVMIDGEPWFVGRDVATALGYAKPENAIRDNVDDGDTLKQGIPTNGGNQQMLVINEYGLYDLVLGSRLENAKKFKRWITHDVIPSLRQNGGYIVGQEKMTSEQIIANALILANKVIEDKNKQIAQMQPKSDYFDRLVNSKLLTTFRDCAKEFNMKPRAFTDWLRDNGYVYNDRHNIIKPYQPYVESGLFSLKDFNTPYGYSNVQTYITVKGKETFRLLLGICK